MSSYIPVIGLEIHAELLTKSKVFCTCSAEFGGSQNSRCCPVCTGMPGMHGYARNPAGYQSDSG